MVSPTWSNDHWICMDQTCSLGGCPWIPAILAWTNGYQGDPQPWKSRNTSYRFSVHQLAHLPLISIFLSSVPSLSGITGDRGMQDTLDSVCESNALEKRSCRSCQCIHQQKINWITSSEHVQHKVVERWNQRLKKSTVFDCWRGSKWDWCGVLHILLWECDAGSASASCLSQDQLNTLKYWFTMKLCDT